MNTSLVDAKTDTHTPSPKIEVADGSLSPDSGEYNEPEDFISSAMAATGTQSRELSIVLVDQLVNAFGPPKEGSAPLINAALAALAEQKPTNATEALLATQMVAIHTQLMGLLARAANTPMAEIQKNYINIAMKLARVFTAQAETLRRMRQKGQQTINVHHVHLNNEGGQAIIGNVTQPNRDGV